MKFMNPDEAYIKKRIQLIPIAIQNAKKEVKVLREQKKNAQFDVEFHRQMLYLTVASGICNPGNIKLFEAKTLPMYHPASTLNKKDL